MIENVDHIIIAVEDLKSAEDNYTKIFGRFFYENINI